MRPALVRDLGKAEVYSHKEVCDLAMCSYGKLATMRDRGMLPFRPIKFGAEWRYPRQAVDAWLRGELEQDRDAE